MQKYYLTEWHEIPFTSFTTPSPYKRADTAFYAAFYTAFFSAYASPHEIDPEVLTLKNQTMELVRQVPQLTKESHILSIGCGLGLGEKAMIEDGYKNVEVTEVAYEPLRWLLPHIAEENVHIGFFPDCVPPDKRYHCIFACGIEYAFSRKQFMSFLRSVRERLLPGGVCLLLSWTWFDKNGLDSLTQNAKDTLKRYVFHARLNNLGQWLGYKRSCGEFRRALLKTGFIIIKDGVLEKKTSWDTYWIRGEKVNSEFYK